MYNAIRVAFWKLFRKRVESLANVKKLQQNFGKILKLNK